MSSRRWTRATTSARSACWSSRPRTATVIATTDAVLYRIPGEDFLRIVNEGPRLSPTLVSVVANRLAASNPYDELGHS